MRLLLRNFGLPAPRGGVVQGLLLAAFCTWPTEPAELFCRGWPVRHSFAPSAPPRRRAALAGCWSPWKSHVTSRYAGDSSVHEILAGRALDQLLLSASRDP